MATMTAGSALAPDMTSLRAQIRKRYVGPTLQPTVPGRAAVSPSSESSFGIQGQGKILPPPPPPAAAAATGVAPVAHPWQSINQSSSYVPGNINFGAGFGGTLNDILRNFLGSGAFSDQPNMALLSAIRSQAEQTAAGQRDHASLLAESEGLDPATAASLGLRADLGAQGGVASTVNNAVTGELQSKQDYGQRLLMALLGGQGQQNAYNPNKFDWGSIISRLIPSGGYTIGGGSRP